MKTQGLKQALDQYQFDAAFGVLEEMRKSRAKEEFFLFELISSVGSQNQRPELWNLYNAKSINPKV